MGVANVVSSLSKYVDHRERVRFCFTHSAWTAVCAACGELAP